MSDLLPDPVSVGLVELRAKVLPQIVTRLGEVERESDAVSADALRREVDAYSRLMKDREVRRMLAAHAHLAGLLIAYLVPERVKPGPKKDPPNPGDLSISDQRLSEYRYLVEHDRDYAREQFEQGKTLNAVLKAVEDRVRERERPRAERSIIEHADCSEWLPEQPDCDLLLTDPPYSTDLTDVGDFARRWLPLALEKVRPTGRAYVFIGAYPEELSAYLSTAMPTQVLAWTYRNTLGPSAATRYILNWQAILYYEMPAAPALGAKKMAERFAVQDVAAPDGRFGPGRFHRWEKPMQLAERLVEHATQPGDLVLDPFAGSGTHLLAATRLGRIGRGCDSDPQMVELAGTRGVEVGGERVAA